MVVISIVIVVSSSSVMMMIILLSSVDVGSTDRCYFSVSNYSLFNYISGSVEMIRKFLTQKSLPP